MEDKTINLEDISRYPKRLEKLILDQARKINELLKLAFSAMHARTPQTSFCSWYKVGEKKYLRMATGEHIELAQTTEKELDGIPMAIMPAA